MISFQTQRKFLILVSLAVATCTIMAITGRREGKGMPDPKHGNRIKQDTPCPADRLYGSFLFNQVDLKAILKELSKWYHVEVKFEGTIKDKPHFGTFSRCESLQSILSFLESQLNVHIILKNKIITVRP